MMGGKICFFCGMKGCGGRLCRICRPILKRYTMLRYSADRFGEPDMTSVVKRYKICGYISVQGSSRYGGRLEIEGRRDKKTAETKLLTVAAFGGRGILCGDRLIDGNIRYRVTEVMDRSGCVMARLTAEGEQA